jgi:hypothetical protein
MLVTNYGNNDDDPNDLINDSIGMLEILEKDMLNGPEGMTNTQVADRVAEVANLLRELTPPVKLPKAKKKGARK